MTAPTWDQYMAPALRFLLDGEIKRLREIVHAAGDGLALTAQQREIVIPSGQEQWLNRGNWAISYLNRVGAIERTSRAHYRITDVGRKLLADHPDGITEKNLRALAGEVTATHTWKLFPTTPGNTAEQNSNDDDAAMLAPREQIDQGIKRINADVATDLLDRILAQDPAFFENAVLKLLVAMGYGGAEGTAVRTQTSGDGGIDGTVDQDALGLSRIYVQAKRYGADNIVGRPAIQGFVGALAGNQAHQGVFITTSRFSADARAYADSVTARVVLVDGDRLTRLMIKYGVGVQVKDTIKIVEVDEDFFDDV
ncbi:MAG TPA: restriction endonuclease [Gordonia sp. (in: high G+C Gram-positive bacteria)]|uniref:restriction endonuclease n=1 Tax=unclassified Gordonia (in: high G+C Gram-positive bacteria) TaxID=2657482 RepID=UPI000F9C2D72|nr:MULTISPECIES: restriction endonuclease [unclassified Gordonia (in: high G+C Gram-positive bacteria)]RUP41065.1 MAG: restriction endonuclease [Gordonia sp. (in: high G+C Gram-positive bacteria)]HNP58286.1 restriction endonuclease [Gordonia sp. (in: high G+C Gram-positive bacteria)]HRC52072.1 restriction endonuclease [Gordonia sp. (in: high G+C Gram-positive bacteria)]